DVCSSDLRVGRGEPAPRHVGPLSPCGCGGKTRSYLLERHHGPPQVSGGATLLADSSSPSRRSGGQSFSRLASSNPNAIHTIMPMTAKTTGSATTSSHTRSHTSMSLHLDPWLLLPVPLRPGLRVADGGAEGNVLAGAREAASWGAADAQIRRPRGQ